MAEGDVSIVGYAATDQGESYPHRSRGTRQIVRELALQPMWIAPVQMAQLEPSHKWCACCGVVKPFADFNPVALEALIWEVLITAIQCELSILFDSPLMSRLAYVLPKTLFKWCDTCQKRYAPETLGLQYCPDCQMWRDPADFYSRNTRRCIPHEKERKREAYKVEVGREVRHYKRTES